MAATADCQKILEYDVPSAYCVPGGAAAIVKDGELVAQHCWGFANIDSREPVTSETVFPICSISKQYACTIDKRINVGYGANLRQDGMSGSKRTCWRERPSI